jgi:hypothetical protein
MGRSDTGHDGFTALRPQDNALPFHPDFAGLQRRCWSMIPKGVQRFSEKIMLEQ